MSQSLFANFLQVVVVMLLSPLLRGILNRWKERLQAKRGPSIFQVYYDLWKLFHKDQVFSETSSWIFRFTPYLVFVAPIFVTLLIPVLTSYPLFFAFMGDMVGGGFVLALAGFFASLAAVDTSNPYGAMGASRTRMVSFLAEPVFMMVFFTVAFVAGSTIPYIVQQYWVASSSNFFDPSHVLVMAAFFMLIIAETGSIPVDNPSGHFELAMIDESKSLEYSGSGAALMKWGSSMKLFVLLTIFCNVLVSPWGLASGHEIADVLAAVPLVMLKLLTVGALLVVIESTFSKLRLFRITEFLGVAFILSIVAAMTKLLQL